MAKYKLEIIFRLIGLRRSGRKHIPLRRSGLQKEWIFSVIFGCAAVGVFESHCDAVIQRSKVNGSHCAAVEERIGDCAAVTRLKKKKFLFQRYLAATQWKKPCTLRRSGRNQAGYTGDCDAVDACLSHCAAVRCRIWRAFGLLLHQISGGYKYFIAPTSQGNQVFLPKSCKEHRSPSRIKAISSIDSLNDLLAPTWVVSNYCLAISLIPNDWYNHVYSL